MDNDRLFGMPKSLVKLIVGSALIIATFVMLGSHSNCWFSINCNSGSTLVGPEIAVGGLAALALVSILQVPVAPAIAAGVAIWAVLQYWL